MNNNNLLESVLEINRDTAKDLFKTYSLSGEPNTNAKPSRLIFPKYRKDEREKTSSDGKLRISEQEARLLFCLNLEKNKNNKYLYSIETPTKESYNFRKNDGNGRSALSDLSIYGSPEEKLINIEFKTYNPRKESYNKDIEKLMREEICGNWFHLLKNTDKGTIKSLNGKFKSALGNVIDKEKYNSYENKGFWLLFFIVILDKKKIKHKILDFSKLRDKNYLGEFFPEKDDWKSELLM